MSEEGRGPVGVSPLEAGAFLAELLLLSAFAVGGAGLAHGLSALVLAIALPVLVAVGWGIWLAPRSSHRLSPVAGYVTKVVLFSVAAGLIAATRSVLWAGLFWLGSVAIVSAAEAARRAE